MVLNKDVSFRVYKERDFDWKGWLQAATEHAKKSLAVYNEEKPNLSKITFLFNRARTLEDNRQFNQAAAIYTVGLFLIFRWTNFFRTS